MEACSLLVNLRKGMQSLSEQPLVGEERYVMTLITAAKETICNAVECSLMELANEERSFGSVASYVTCARNCNVCQLVEESVSSIQVILCPFINERRSFIPFSIDFRVVTGAFFSPLRWHMAVFVRLPLVEAHGCPQTSILHIVTQLLMA